MRLRLRLVDHRRRARNSLERIREKFHVTRRDQLDPWYQQQVALHEAQITLLTQQIQDLETAVAELGRITYQVLTKQEDFNGTFRGVPLERTKTRQWPRSTSPAA